MIIITNTIILLLFTYVPHPYSSLLHEHWTARERHQETHRRHVWTFACSVHSHCPSIFLWLSCHMTLSVLFVPHHIVRVVRSTLLARLVWCFHVCTHTHIDISPTFDLIRLVTHTNIPLSNISHEMWLSDHTFCPHVTMVMWPHPLDVELGCMHACIDVELGIILMLWMCNWSSRTWLRLGLCGVHSTRDYIAAIKVARARTNEIAVIKLCRLSDFQCSD